MFIHKNRFYRQISKMTGLGSAGVWGIFSARGAAAAQPGDGWIVFGKT
jgi:hypothetical protein